MTLREQLRRARPSVDSPLYRLLTGEITDAEYRAHLTYGWPLPVAREGWARRWYRVVTTVLYALLALAFGAIFVLVLSVA